jgi:hypothetical protein
MDNNNYAKLNKLLTDFETCFRKAELKTDELCDLGDRLNSLQDLWSHKESTDSEE